MSEELKRQNDTWNKAWLTKDVAAVERLAAKDYIYIGPQGQVLRRADILKIVGSQSYRLARGKWTGVSMSALGSDAAGLWENSVPTDFVGFMGVRIPPDSMLPQGLNGIPDPDPAIDGPKSAGSRLVAIPVLNALHHDYRLAA